MTGKESLAKMRDVPRQLIEIDGKIVTVARGLISVLQDAGRPASAKELESLFFERDVVLQDMKQFAHENLDAIINALKDEAGPR